MIFGQNGRFSLLVQQEEGAAERPLKEYCSDGSTWVMSVFDVPSTFREEVEESDPFGDTYKQTWPFTPFMIKVAITDPAPGEYFKAKVSLLLLLQDKCRAIYIYARKAFVPPHTTCSRTRNTRA
jgi:hypothetical protein